MIALAAVGCGGPAQAITSSAPSGRTPPPPVDVSAQFQATPGVRVQQLTGGPDAHELSYYDIQAWAPQPNRLIYNDANPAANTWSVASSRTDGSDPRTLVTRTPPETSANRADLSSDGKFVSYLRDNSNGEPGFDLYGFIVGDGITVHEVRITHNDYSIPVTPPPTSNGENKNGGASSDSGKKSGGKKKGGSSTTSTGDGGGTDPAGNTKTSPSVFDAASGHYDIAFAIGPTMYVVQDNGIAPNGTAGPMQVALNDPEQGQRYHRIKLDPRFPNILMYWHGKDPDHWVTDWKNSPGQSVQWWNPTYHDTHPSWNNDGLSIGLETDQGVWQQVTVATADGRLIPGLNAANAQQQTIGNFGTSGPLGAAYYTAYSPDGRYMTLDTSPFTDSGGRLYLVNVATGHSVYLCQTHVLAADFDGHARLQFYGGTQGDDAIVFSTNDSYGQSSAAPAQLYTITNASGGPLPLP